MGNGVKHITFSVSKKKERWAFRWSKGLLGLLVFVAIFADFLANEKPIYCELAGETHFPIFHEYGVNLGLTTWKLPFVNTDWQKLPLEKSIFPPIPYSPTTQDAHNWHVSPLAAQQVASLRFRHWLGSHQVGQDVAAGLIHGTRKALLIGLLAMSIATLIGVFLGILAGYFGDGKCRISYFQLMANLFIFPFALFYGFIKNMDNPNDLSFETMIFQNLSIFLGIFILLNAGIFFLQKQLNVRKTLRLPLDLLIMRLVEVMNSIPPLLLLLALVAVLEKSSLWHIAVLIGLMGWTSLTRFTRGEILKIREMPYIEAGQALGFSRVRIMFRHILPNALSPLLIVLAFGMAGTILLEASLSFLGYGGGVEEVTWGTLLAQAREKPNSWWLAVFPGFAIFLTVMVFNFLGDREGN